MSYNRASYYGLTDAELETLVARADGVCEICQSVPHVHIDHDHATKRVRGLLCRKCNRNLPDVEQGRREPSDAEALYLAFPQVGRGHRATPLRQIRVPDDVWEAAHARAASEGTTVSALIVQRLERWTGIK